MRTFVLLLAGWLLSTVALQAQSKAPCKAPITVKDIANPNQKLGVSITLKQRGVVLQEEAHVAPKCMVKIPAEGEYQVIVACKGYVTQTVTLNLSCEQEEAPVVLLCPQGLETVNFEDGIDSTEATLIAGHYYNRKGFTAREGTVKDTPVWECRANSVSKGGEGMPTSNRFWYVAVSKATGEVIDRGSGGTR